MKTDKAYKALFALVLVMFPLNFYLIFKVAPVEIVMGIVQKIFYLHISLAVTAAVAFTVVFVSSIIVLWKKSLVWDTVAYSAAEIGLLFATLVLMTGMIWARPIWNVWWTWDPRLITMLILWFIYTGYFFLRNGITDRIIRAKYAAVLSIFGFVEVPIVKYSTKWWRSIHPLLTKEGGGLDPEMKMVMLFSMVTFVLFAVFLFILRYRVAKNEERLMAIKRKTEEL